MPKPGGLRLGTTRGCGPYIRASARMLNTHKSVGTQALEVLEALDIQFPNLIERWLGESMILGCRKSKLPETKRNQNAKTRRGKTVRKGYSTIPNVLAFTTVRLECTTSNQECAIGTGFHLKFGNSGESILVTNKHVVDKAIKGKVSFTVSSNESREPEIGNYFEAVLENLAQTWIPHPDPTVDLAAIPISGLKARYDKNHSQSQVFLPPIVESLIPSRTELEEMRLIEDVIMVGYPIGLWDSVNNLPVVRRGITATHPGISFEGRTEFLIDCACFPGSSGSPVFRYTPELPVRGSGGITITGGGAQLALLGVLYAGPQYSVDGIIAPVNIPTMSSEVSKTNVPINIGMVIRSERLLEFEQLI